jgi:hypothetical protein
MDTQPIVGCELLILEVFVQGWVAEELYLANCSSSLRAFEGDLPLIA